MAEPHAYSQPIQTYGPAPHNRNIWPSPTRTASQYKHMAQRRIIETYGHTIAGRRRRGHAWPILLFALVLSVISLLTTRVNSLATLSSTKYSNCNSSIHNNCVFQSSSRAKLLYSCFFLSNNTCV